jgi:hypothetical protein
VLHCRHRLHLVDVRVGIYNMHAGEKMSVPLAKPSAAPLTPSAAATVEAKAAKAATI